MNVSEVVRALMPLIDTFERLDIAYYIGGLVASSVRERGRYVQDIDVVAAIGLDHVQSLVSMLQQEYSINAEVIRRVIRSQSSFNVLHNDTGVKIDVSIHKTRAVCERIDPIHEMRLEI
jgi:hypothetical protein